MKSFQQQLDDAYQKKVVERLENAVRFFALSFYGGVKLMTPVDTGRARANWGMDINMIDVSLVEPDSPKDAEAVVRYKLKDIIYISNHLPYINRLNEGHSDQAPAGFVEDALLLATSQTERKFK